MTAAELMSHCRTPRSLTDLPESDPVLVEHVEYGAVCHLTRDRRTALCGAPTGWGPSAGHMVRLSGGLYPACVGRWPS